MNLKSPHPHIRARLAQGVATIELANPARLNALSFPMADALEELVRDVAWRPETKVLVLSGEGRSFCAGYDVTTERRGGSPRISLAEASHIKNALDTLGAAPVVRIARLHGHVVGAGLALAQQCHLRYAARGTRFMVPELDLGIPFLLGGMSLLMRDVGPVRAADMILNCTPLAAEHPDASRLVTEVLEPEALDARVLAVAERLAARPEALLLASTIGLDRAASDLLPPAPSDLFAGMVARADPEALRVSADYVAALRGKARP